MTGRASEPPAEADPEPARREELQPDLARNESARNESARNESARNESARNESARNESARNESARNESARNESARNESAGSEPEGNESAEKQAQADLERAQNAFHEGDVLAARQQAEHVLTHCDNEHVREQAEALLEQTKPDPLIAYLLIASAIFLVVVTLFAYGTSST